jgi:hypothetical protein
VAACISKAEQDAKASSLEGKRWKAEACKLLWKDHKGIASQHAPSHLAALIRDTAQSDSSVAQERFFDVLSFCRG